MRILVTGARGKVGAATVAALADAGHDVTATDLGRPSFEATAEAVAYKQADLTDAGDAFAVVRGHDAVVHAAAIPEPTQNPPHTSCSSNNLMATFNTLEAAVRWGVPRFVNLSSETVPGFFFPERPFLPDYVPVDEEHPIRPQDPYATAKHFGEQLMDAATRRSDITASRSGPRGCSGRATTSATSARGCASRRCRRASGPTSTSTTSPTRSGSPRRRRRPATRSSTSRRPTSRRTSRSRSSRAASTATRRRESGRRTSRPSGISIAKARRLLGYDPQRSWRDYLDDDGRLRPAVARAAGARRDRRAARAPAHRRLEPAGGA